MTGYLFTVVEDWIQESRETGSLPLFPVRTVTRSDAGIAPGGKPIHGLIAYLEKQGIRGSV
jgi:hypothetical protein